MKLLPQSLSFVLCIILAWSCSKEKFTSNADALLIPGVDTLHFDTVFTTTGSVSQIVKIFNNNDAAINISSIELAGGANSFYKINVDGIPGPVVNNVNILAEDSLYVFVTVSIDPTADELPFIVRDSIKISYNGNSFWVQLEAYGQNAHFFRNKIVSSSETWNNDLPYVILERLTVEPGALLTINKGSRIYVHADAPILVQGSLHVLGEKQENERVVFTGDRLDEPYKNFPASYPGIIFMQGSENNILRYTTIKNAYQAIVCVDPSPGIKLKLQQTIIDNAYDAGILAINTSIEAENLLVRNCGKNIVIVKGGNYVFEHSTIAAYSTGFIQHREPAVAISNYLLQDNILSAADLNASFNNCIIWGESGGFVDEEVITSKQDLAFFNLSFNNILWRVENNPANSVVTGFDLKNTDPEFDTIKPAQNLFNFRLKSFSPAIDKAISALTLDLDGNPRPVNLPDLGAYEAQ